MTAAKVVALGVIGVAVVILFVVGNNGKTSAVEAEGSQSEPGRHRLALAAVTSNRNTTLEPERAGAGTVVVSAASPQRSAEETAVHVAGLADDWLYASAEDFERSMRSVFAPDHHEELRAIVLNHGVGLMRTALATAPSQEATWFFTQPLSTAVVQESSALAVVQVWDVSVFSREGVSEPTATWTMHEVELVSVDGRWMVSDWQSKPGPVPRTHQLQDPSRADVLTAKLFEHHRVDSDALGGDGVGEVG